VLLRKIIKYLASLSPVSFTKNEYYDRLTEKIIKRVCPPNAVCADVGAHTGKVLQVILRNCPAAMHYAFEPIPDLYHKLKRKYGSACHVYNIALSNSIGYHSFTYVITDPAYSGLKKRRFDKPEKYTDIRVKTHCLDHIISPEIPITLIKMDVEGGEYDVIRGAEKTISRWKPYILFEFGRGGSDVYGVSPAMMYTLLCDNHQLRINLLKRFLKNLPPLTLAGFEEQYKKGREFFFIAYP